MADAQFYPNVGSTSSMPVSIGSGVKTLEGKELLKRVEALEARLTALEARLTTIEERLQTYCSGDCS